MEGAGARLRSILMTSFAFLAGLMPLVFAHGAGALGNRANYTYPQTLRQWLRELASGRHAE